MIYPISNKIPTRSNYEKIKQILNPTKHSVIYHKGGIIHTRDDTDVELDFRQESNFFYLSGVEAAGYHILILTDTDEIYLIPPTVPSEHQLWKGIPDSHDTLIKKYDVNHILTEEELPSFLTRLKPSLVYTLPSTDTSLLSSLKTLANDRYELVWAVREARLIKNPWEISTLRYAAHISSHAHLSLMSYVARHDALHEAELEARFRWMCAKNGLTRQCYIPIVASGHNAAILHYTDNNKPLPLDSQALVLVDAGGERQCYGSDITRTFPVCGKFSEEAKDIYNIVLKAQNSVLACLKPGVHWQDMSALAIRILCEGLKNLGILKGDLDELLKLSLYKAFYFHGLGHSVGIDCHDVGGEGIGIASNRKGQPLEQLNRPLEENMVITVEPGLYFNDVSIQQWTSKYETYFDFNKINQYRVIGGVRIEDTVLITKEGHENFTIVPKEIKDIEAIMKA
ncbi:hypothetical protein G6F37_003133 [Rhizopus arrhizus]|nr:hypothetical protein G6F38_001001 [Rhizopus arrhizus]KAG1161371.1 hypothetical protein G6F37_003133 [Rhizopus arrhizus]